MSEQDLYHNLFVVCASIDPQSAAVEESLERYQLSLYSDLSLPCHPHRKEPTCASQAKFVRCEGTALQDPKRRSV